MLCENTRVRVPHVEYAFKHDSRFLSFSVYTYVHTYVCAALNAEHGIQSDVLKDHMAYVLVMSLLAERIVSFLLRR